MAYPAVKNANNNTEPTLVLEIIRTIASTKIDGDNFDEILSNTADLVAEYLNASCCFIMLSNEHGEMTEFFGNNKTATVHFETDAIMNKVTDSGNGVIEQSNALPDTTTMCVALAGNDSVSGLIYATSQGECKWDENTLKAVEIIGSYLGMSIMNIDLREQCEQNERLAMAGRATLDLSHSVKNILQMVGGAAEVIDLGLKTDQMDRVVRSWDILKPNLDRLRKFMLDMLDFGKERPLELSKCDFNRIIQDAVNSLKSQLEQKPSNLNIQIDQKMPIVELDSERVLEMALNIILNAIDIVDEKDGVVCVQTHYHKDTQMIELQVTDNGPGMDEEMKTKLFTPFESGKNKLGTGLGMAIAKRTIDTHNGRIEVKSDLGKGTTIAIQLPANVIE